ncbi:hypothetical protein MFIFM68171_02837 [Madurella fahalii]|uniref:Cyclochlorotine biosynthesis protein O n=1 Tax=Madurella fahalii TaxID=1157608 RepID=A0ABQ0G4F1_9PEZI
MSFPDDSKLIPSEGQLLLGEDSYEGDEHLRRQHVKHSARKFGPFYLHGILILLYSAIYLALVIPTLRGTPNPGPEGQEATPKYPLPAREALVWEERRFPTDITNNALAGGPRPELDEAWHRLLRNDNILVPKEYLDELNLTSIYTKDGLHGIASLSVYHSLHCLKQKKVKRMIFKEYYHKGKSEEAMAREAKHVDHCVEYIREALMCQPDLSLVTFRWINNTAQHEDKSAFYPTNFDVSMHTCAKWEPLDEWAGGRRFNLFDVDLLRRPQPGGHT